MMRALCLRALKWGSGKRKKSFESCMSVDEQSALLSGSRIAAQRRTHLSLLEKVRQELHRVRTEDANVPVSVTVRRHELRLDASNLGDLALR